MEVERQQRRFVRPIFEELALALRPPGEPVEVRPIIGAEAGESGQIMGARQHVHAVDLVEAEPLDGLQKLPGAGCLGSPRAETLRGERDPPGEREADPFYGHHCRRFAMPVSSGGASQPKALRPP